MDMLKGPAAKRPGRRVRTSQHHSQRSCADSMLYWSADVATPPPCPSRVRRSDQSQHRHLLPPRRRAAHLDREDANPERPAGSARTSEAQASPQRRSDDPTTRSMRLVRWVHPSDGRSANDASRGQAGGGDARNAREKDVHHALEQQGVRPRRPLHRFSGDPAGRADHDGCREKAAHHHQRHDHVDARDAEETARELVAARPTQE
jgi:hypothetical protein